MEESDLKDMTGYAPPDSTGETESFRKLGSMKKLTLGRTEAKKVRTFGRNIIEATKTSPPMVAYIDEIVPIQRHCIRCNKWLADGKVNWTYKFRWGLETRNTKRDDQINNPPIVGVDVYAEPIENHLCKECELEI